MTNLQRALVSPATGSEVGKWNGELFDRFKRAKGEKRRALKNELIRTNLPLVKILVGQVAGIADEKTSSRRRNASRKRVVGADECEWDDLLQMGMEAFAHALEKFDPEKGKIAGYARWWILTKVQRFVRKEHLITAPEGKHAERPAVALVDDEEELERLSADHEWGGMPEVDGITAADVQRWDASGVWPETLAEVQRAREPQPPPPRRVYSLPRPAIEVFLERMCVFGRRHDRAPIWPLWNAWRVESRLEGRPEGTRAMLIDALGRRGADETRVREGGQRAVSTPVRGARGMRLVLATTT